jgi:hypothetical protein
VDDVPVKNKDDQVAEEFFAELGLAVFTAQALEYSLTSLYAATELACKTRHPIPVDLKGLMDTRYQQTLGRLVRNAAHSLDLDAKLTSRLAAALQERNWLVHRFYGEFAPSAFSTDLRLVARQRLLQARTVFEEVTERISTLTMSRMLRTGIPDAELMKGIEKVTRDYIHERLDETT